MPSRRPALVLATLSLVAVSMLPAPAQSETLQCRRGDLMRRIEVQFADDADRLPCRVVYWRNPESGEPPRVPWNAEHQREFCIDKAREMADSLRSAGWTCDKPPPAEEAADIDAAAPSERASREPAAAGATAPSPGEDGANGSGEPDRATLHASPHRTQPLPAACVARYGRR